MAEAHYHVGDTRKLIAEQPDASIDLVLTSPPFLALRSYLPDDHPDKALEIGGEATPAEFIDALLDVVEALEPKLTEHGSLVFELGDTYAGSGSPGGDYAEGGMRDGQPRTTYASTRARTDGGRYGAGYLRADGRVNAQAEDNGGYEVRPPKGAGSGWPLDKSLCGIPHLFHLSLAYGRNLLRPERTTDPWRIRNVVAWCRPNPPVGALGDKFRPGTSYMTVATKARDRWFDLDAVREPHKDVLPNGKPMPRAKYADGRMPSEVRGDYIKSTTGGRNDDGKPVHGAPNPAGAPPLDHWWFDDDVFDQDAWLVSTEPYAGSHYATWPRKLLTRPILAMCPERVCTTCGLPSRRIVETEGTGQNTRKSRGSEDDPRQVDAVSSTEVPDYAERRTVGWSDCGHGTWRPGVVLDPFAGSGTTLAVATGHGRDAIGFDIDGRNAALALERVGPLFLTVHE